ncbi:MAG: response regulator [Anaerolineales bacterium]|uniref:ATP-binding protein n=1 Tax=Candidatus Villigracilis proximus TaxID=3140683 RepID=UPI003136F461|nr:response regulator [Anaerolineales bacterium]
MTDPRKLPQILYIEDSDEARSLVRRLLSHKYVVLEAIDPLNGLQLAEETQPSLILVDYSLPHMTGNEAATRLKKMLPDTPIVIVSGDLSVGARERALAAGAVGFISKPIDADFIEQVDAYLDGKVEILEDAEKSLQAYQQELVERLEGNIRQLSTTVEKNKHLLQQNERMFSMLERRHKLLETAARVGQMVTSILAIDDLLKHTVNIICSEFNLYYSGIFLVSEDEEWAVLRAGYAAAGRKMMSENYRLHVDEKSMIGNSIIKQQAQIALDVAGEESRFMNPFLPNTRSEMALPLIVQSQVTSLQAMADQIAIAINNAQLMFKLEAATAEIVRTKTFEAIATATGEAIHWVGNKAAPIPGSIKRVREDMLYILALAAQFVPNDSDAENASLTGAVQTVREEAQAMNIDLDQVLADMSAMKKNRLQALVSVESLMEDLEIAENSAVTILSIKEGLIGPARQRNDAVVSLSEMIADTVANMGLPDGVVELEWAADMPNAFVDARQVEQVFNNLIKNSWEAMAKTSAPKIYVSGMRDSNPKFVLVSVKDNGPGIPKEIQEKIWVSFFTTKGGSGGTGLGLSSVMQIVNQHGGSISLESEVGKGAMFSVRLPVEKKFKTSQV